MNQESIYGYQVANNLRLPVEYIDFMVKFNGGTCRHELIALDDGTQVFCDCLFGFGLKDEMSFTFWQQEFAGDLPRDCLVIGSDPGGGFFLLMNLNGEWTVMYYDHSYALPSSNDIHNTYRCNVDLFTILSMVDRPFNA
jgi:hypothetical protein